MRLSLTRSSASGQLHRLAHFGEGGASGFAGLFCASGKNVVDQRGVLSEVSPALPDRGQVLVDDIGEHQFHVQTAKAAGFAFLVEFRPAE